MFLLYIIVHHRKMTRVAEILYLGRPNDTVQSISGVDHAYPEHPEHVIGLVLL